MGVSAPGGAVRGVPAAPRSLARRRHSRATTTGLTKATSTTAISPTFTWGGVRVWGWGLAPPMGCPGSSPQAPRLGAGPPFPVGQDACPPGGQHPDPTRGRNPIPPQRGTPSPGGRTPVPPGGSHGANTHVERVPAEWPAHQGDTGVLQQGHQRRQRHGQPVQLPKVLWGEPARPPGVTSVPCTPMPPPTLPPCLLTPPNAATVLCPHPHPITIFPTPP